MVPTSTVRIAAVRVTPILIADPPLLNLQGVHQPYTPRTIVEIETENGVIGVGETYGDTEYLELAQAVAGTLPHHRLTDLNLLAVRTLRALEQASTGPADTAVNAAGLRGARSTEKLVASVASAFEVASFDALGRELGMPVHALLGGKVRDSVEYSGYLFYRWAEHPAGAAAGDLPTDDWGDALDPAGVVEQAKRMARDYGFTSFKLKGGAFPPAEEVAAIRALSDTFPGHPLRLDPNGAWSVPTSIEVAKSLAGIAEYLEDPTLGTPNMAEVARHSELPLATNMCVTSFREIPAAFSTDAVQVVLSDHHFWGGLRATQDLAAVCRTFGVAVSMHSNTHLGISLAAMTHVASTIPDLQYACDTHRPWQTEDVITQPHEFRDGRIEVPDSPGLGVHLDRESLVRLHKRWVDSDVRDRDDVAAMRLTDPQWTSPVPPRW